MDHPWISNFRRPGEGQIYFDSASRSPIPINVEEIGHEYLSMKGCPWNFNSNESDVLAIRECFSRLINSSSDCIALAPSTSFAISLAARNILKSGNCVKGSKILVLENEMASNVYSWQRICEETGAVLSVISSPADGDWVGAIGRNLDNSVVVLAVSSVHWCDGSLINLKALSNCLETIPNKPYVIVDGTQSVGAYPINMRELDAVDFMACSVHKWLNGPYGCSLMYLHPRHHNHWLPLDNHERSQQNVNNTREWDEIGVMSSTGYPENFVSGAGRLDSGGRPNPVLMPMIRTALENLLHWDVSNIQSYLQSLTGFLIREIQELNLGFIFVPDEFRCGHIFGLRLPQATSPVDAASMLATNLKQEKVFVSARYGVLRVSPYLNNTKDDCVRFLLALVRVMREYRSLQSLPVPPSSTLDRPSASVATATTVLMTGATGWLGQFITKKILSLDTPAQATTTATPNTTTTAETNRSSSGDSSSSNRMIDLHVTYHSPNNIPDWMASDKTHALDLESYEQIDTLIRQLRPTVFIHLAALTSPAICAKMPDKAMSINCPSFLTYCIMKYVPDCAFIFTSTDLVYDGESAPYVVRTEAPTEITPPSTVYGATKLAYEHEVVSCLPNSVVLRLSNMIGPKFAYRYCGTKFLQWLCQCCEKREFVGLRSDEFRSFVAVTDVVEIIVKIALSASSVAPLEEQYMDTDSTSASSKRSKGERMRHTGRRRVFNVGGPRGLSRLELGRLVAQAMGVEFVVCSPDLPSSGGGASTGSAVRGAEASSSEETTTTWRVHSTTNDESIKSTGIQNPRDVSMLSSETEGNFGVTFKDMIEVIKLSL